MSHKEQNVLCKESKTPNRFDLTSNNNHNILNASQDRQIWNLKVLRYKSEFVGQQVVRTEQQKQFHCLALRLEKSQTSRGIPISLALYIKHGLCCQTHASDQLRQSDCLTVLVNVYRVSIRSHMTLEQINQPPSRFIRHKKTIFGTSEVFTICPKIEVRDLTKNIRETPQKMVLPYQGVD